MRTNIMCCTVLICILLIACMIVNCLNYVFCCCELLPLLLWMKMLLRSTCRFFVNLILRGLTTIKTHHLNRIHLFTVHTVTVCCMLAYPPVYLPARMPTYMEKTQLHKIEKKNNIKSKWKSQIYNNNNEINKIRVLSLEWKQ